MKKILFISKSCATENHLISFLENHFAICESEITIEKIWKTLIKQAPDILIINLADLKSYHKIFSHNLNQIIIMSMCRLLHMEVKKIMLTLDLMFSLLFM